MKYWMRTAYANMHIFTDQNTQAFKEVAIIRHPRIGEYAFGFITSFVTLQVCIKLQCLVDFRFRTFTCINVWSDSHYDSRQLLL